MRIRPFAPQKQIFGLFFLDFRVVFEVDKVTQFSFCRGDNFLINFVKKLESKGGFIRVEEIQVQTERVEICVNFLYFCTPFHALKSVF